MDKDKREGWLKELGKGDRVAVSSHWYGYNIKTVDKITPTGRIVVNGTTYDHRGHEMNTPRFSIGNNLCELTYELEEKIEVAKERNKAVQAIKSLDWNNVSTEKLKKVIEIII